MSLVYERGSLFSLVKVSRLRCTSPESVILSFPMRKSVCSSANLTRTTPGESEPPQSLHPSLGVQPAGSLVSSCSVGLAHRGQAPPAGHRRALLKSAAKIAAASQSPPPLPRLGWRPWLIPCSPRRGFREDSSTLDDRRVPSAQWGVRDVDVLSEMKRCG